MKIWSGIGIAITALWLSGCASPGAPQPPSLRLPRRVQDLNATRKGNHVLLTWTPPTQTSDGENIRQAGQTEICRTTDAMPMVKCGTPIKTLDNIQVEHWTKGSMVSRIDYTDMLPETLIQQNPLGFATYALEDHNTKGKSAGLSNQMRVPLAPTLPPPDGVQATVTAEGVQFAWNKGEGMQANGSLSFLYRIFRRTEGDEKKPEVIVGEVPLNGAATSFLDRNIEWEQTYLYRIAAITRVQHPGAEPIEVEGEDSPEITAITRDTFPPATPTGLQAVFSGVGQKPFVDLTWAPNLEADLAGYNVYRREAGTSATKINTEPVKTPSFRDSNVEAGHKYFYTLSAVDERGNESAQSEETSEQVPNP